MGGRRREGRVKERGKVLECLGVLEGIERRKEKVKIKEKEKGGIF